MTIRKRADGRHKPTLNSAVDASRDCLPASLASQPSSGGRGNGILAIAKASAARTNAQGERYTTPFRGAPHLGQRPLEALRGQAARHLPPRRSRRMKGFAGELDLRADRSRRWRCAMARRGRGNGAIVSQASRLLARRRIRRARQSPAATQRQAISWPARLRRGRSRWCRCRRARSPCSQGIAEHGRRPGRVRRRGAVRSRPAPSRAPPAHALDPHRPADRL